MFNDILNLTLEVIWGFQIVRIGNCVTPLSSSGLAPPMRRSSPRSAAFLQQKDAKKHVKACEGTRSKSTYQVFLIKLIEVWLSAFMIVIISINFSSMHPISILFFVRSLDGSMRAVFSLQIFRSVLRSALMRLHGLALPASTNPLARWGALASTGRLEEWDEKPKNATNSSASLCDPGLFWVVWFPLWVTKSYNVQYRRHFLNHINISYFLHFFDTASEFIPYSMGSQVTYNWKKSSGPVHATLCQEMQVLQEEMNEKERGRTPTIRAWGYTWALQNVMWSMNPMPMPIKIRSNAYIYKRLSWTENYDEWAKKTCHSTIPARHWFFWSPTDTKPMALLPSFGFSFGSCFLSSL